MKADATLRAWSVLCPACGHSLIPREDYAACVECGYQAVRKNGVWNLLLPEQASAYGAFLDSYTRIRRAEGRVSRDSGFYRRLPHCSRAHPLRRQWAIRRRSYGALRRLLRARLDRGARILDLGAGNGWLSNQLVTDGFSPCAVDLSDDDGDGLGAGRHFATDWPRLAADFDRLPLADGIADAVVFNASFHYSTDYPATLAEACRVTRPGGLVVILDSPVYREADSGRQMLVERHADFARRFGERSDALPVKGFLTWDMLRELGRHGDIEWCWHIPWYGLAWAMRPWRAAIRGGREPARFALLWAVR